jgi:hypothetical protein
VIELRVDEFLSIITDLPPTLSQGEGDRAVVDEVLSN